MSIKTPFLCDRRVYDKKGKWKSPNNDIAENIFYFVKEPLTLVPSYDAHGREQMKETITITVFGGKPFIKEDVIILEDGTPMRVSSYTVNYFETNILVKDLLKQRTESIDLVLE